MEGAALSHHRQLLAYAVNENGLSQLRVLDLASGKERALPETPKGVISGLVWHENNHDLAFGVNSARSPLDAYSLDLISPGWAANESWSRAAVTAGT